MYKSGAVHFINDGKIKVTIVYKGKETTFKVEPDDKVSGLNYFVKIIYPEIDMNSHFLVYNDQILPVFKENLKIRDLCKESFEMKINIIEKGTKIPGLNKAKISSLSKKQLLKIRNPLKLKEKKNSLINNNIGSLEFSETENDNDQEVVFQNNYQQDFKNVITTNLNNVSNDVICKCCHHSVIKCFCRECNEYTCENCKKVLHKKHPFVKINTKNNRENIKAYGITIKKDINTEINKFNFFELMCNNNDSDDKKNNNIYPSLKENIFNKLNDLEQYYENFMNNSGYEKRYIEVKTIVNNINKNISEQEAVISSEIINNENKNFNNTKKYFENFKVNENLLNAIRIKITSYQEDDNIVNKIKNIFTKINDLLNEIKALLKNYAPNNSKLPGKNNKKLKIKLNEEKGEKKHSKLPSAVVLPSLQNLQKEGTVGNLGPISISTKIKKRMSLLKIDESVPNLLNIKVDNINSNIDNLIPKKTETNSQEIIKDINKEENENIKEENIRKVDTMKKGGKLKIAEGRKSKLILKKAHSNDNNNKIKENNEENKIKNKEKSLSEEDLANINKIIIIHTDEDKENNNN